MSVFDRVRNVNWPLVRNVILLQSLIHSVAFITYTLNKSRKEPILSWRLRIGTYLWATDALAGDSSSFLWRERWRSFLFCEKIGHSWYSVTSGFARHANLQSAEIHSGKPVTCLDEGSSVIESSLSWLSPLRPSGSFFYDWGLVEDVDGQSDFHNHNKKIFFLFSSFPVEQKSYLSHIFIRNFYCQNLFKRTANLNGTAYQIGSLF